MAKYVFNPVSGNLDIVPNLAQEIEYDGTSSGLAATDVQDALDEVQANIDSLPNPIYYAGTWDASTNTPTLANTDVGQEGALYQVNVAGTVDFGAGPISFEIGDKVVNNGTVWEKWDMTDAVLSVNGQSGVVVLDTDDVAEGSANLYFTDERAQDATAAALTDTPQIEFTYDDLGNTIEASIPADGLDGTELQNGAVTANKLNDDVYVNILTDSGLSIPLSSTNQTGQFNDGPVEFVVDPTNAPTKSSADETDLLLIADSADSFALKNVNANQIAELAFEGQSLVADRALQSSASGLVEESSVTATELGFLSGVTSSIQTQINNALTLTTLNQNLPQYVLNPQFEVDTSGWATYADAAGTAPVDGTGGSPNVTITRSTSTPLRLTASGLLTKDASNRQGQGWSYDFMVDTADQAKVLQISMDYILNSGTFVAGSSNLSPGDVTVWIYDVTNAVLIQPSTIYLGSNSSTVPATFESTFQTASNSTSYRLIIHVASTSTSAYELKIDKVNVQPSKYVYGTPITDWQSYTPAFTGFGTVTNIDFRWRRVGSNLQVRGTAFTGTTTATEARLGFPTGLTSSTTTNSLKTAGFYANGGSSTNGHGGLTLVENNVSYFTFGPFGTWGSDTINPFSKANGSSAMSSSNTLAFFGEAEILGWSSSVQMSDSSSQRKIAYKFSKSASQTPSGDTVVTLTSANTVFDTTGGYNGANGWVAPVADYYRITAKLRRNSGDGTSFASLGYRLNGSSSTFIQSSTGFANGSAGTISGSDIVFLNAGTVVEMLYNSSGNVACSEFVFSVERSSGPQTIGATETIAASYSVGTGASTANTSPINYEVKDFDTHNAVTTGVGSWRFTAPASGIYSVIGYSANAAGSADYLIYKNGVSHKRVFSANAGTTAMGGGALVSLLAGDYIDIRPSSTITPAGASGSLANTHVSINRIGGR